MDKCLPDDYWSRQTKILNAEKRIWHHCDISFAFHQQKILPVHQLLSATNVTIKSDLMLKHNKMSTIEVSVHTYWTMFRARSCRWGANRWLLPMHSAAKNCLYTPHNWVFMFRQEGSKLQQHKKREYYITYHIHYNLATSTTEKTVFFSVCW